MGDERLRGVALLLWPPCWGQGCVPWLLLRSGLGAGERPQNQWDLAEAPGRVSQTFQQVDICHVGVPAD